MGALVLVLFIGHALIEARREGTEDKEIALLQRRVAVLEATLAARPSPQDTRFGKEMDRRVDRLEDVIFSRQRYQPPPSEYVGP